MLVVLETFLCHFQHRIFLFPFVDRGSFEAHLMKRSFLAGSGCGEDIYMGEKTKIFLYFCGAIFSPFHFSFCGRRQLKMI
jgi:hypothetical protein